MTENLVDQILCWCKWAHLPWPQCSFIRRKFDSVNSTQYEWEHVPQWRKTDSCWPLPRTALQKGSALKLMRWLITLMDLESLIHTTSDYFYKLRANKGTGKVYFLYVRQLTGELSILWNKWQAISILCGNIHWTRCSHSSIYNIKYERQHAPAKVWSNSTEFNGKNSDWIQWSWTRH